MSKSQWLSVLYIIAFAISLAHNSIPHTHPEKEVIQGSHSHNKTDHHHNHGSEKHNHDTNPGSELPVFNHFSNTDFIGGSKYSYTVNERVLIVACVNIESLVLLPKAVDREVPIPRARNLPSSRFRSVQSLRAPPAFS